MALRSGYKGIKKLAAGLKWNRPGVLAVDDITLEDKIMDVIKPSVIANTKLIKDTVGWSGKNKFDKSKVQGIDATITQISNGFRAQVNNHTWGSARLDFPTPAKNTDLTISCYANVTTAGNFMRIQVYGSDDNSTWTSIAFTDFYTISKDLSFTFNSGNYDYLRILFYLTNGTATSADVTFEKPMLCDADILDPTYEPYHESVDSILTELKTTINAIISAATDAADFAAFKTAMGVITPVTRSLSKESFPEEDPAEVIEEKPATRKTTTKKTTEKEGK